MLTAIPLCLTSCAHATVVLSLLEVVAVVLLDDLGSTFLHPCPSLALALILIFVVDSFQVLQDLLMVETLLSGLVAVDAAVPSDLLDFVRKGIHLNHLPAMEMG